MYILLKVANKINVQYKLSNPGVKPSNKWTERQKMDKEKDNNRKKDQQKTEMSECGDFDHVEMEEYRSLQDGTIDENLEPQTGENDSRCVVELFLIQS